MGEAGTSAHAPAHVPVLLDEVLDVFAPLDGKLIVDGTFGAGGYSGAFLEAGARVIGLDRDPGVMPFVHRLKERFGDRLTFVNGVFSRLDEIVLSLDGAPVDGVVLDIGVSSMQLDDGARGFSFREEGPLDMRMGSDGESAAQMLARLTERELSDILFAFGEEKAARRIARAIVAARQETPIDTTGKLARLIEGVLGRKPGGRHPATRSFQALRIAVNGEMNELVRGLFAAERLLPEGGWLAVVTFHSLEDRIVKRFFDLEKRQGAVSRHAPARDVTGKSWVNVHKPRRPGRDEILRNPRARSATLRYAQRGAGQPRPFSVGGLGVPGSSLRGVA